MASDSGPDMERHLVLASVGSSASDGTRIVMRLTSSCRPQPAQIGTNEISLVCPVVPVMDTHVTGVSVAAPYVGACVYWCSDNRRCHDESQNRLPNCSAHPLVVYKNREAPRKGLLSSASRCGMCIIAQN